LIAENGSPVFGKPFSGFALLAKAATAAPVKAGAHFGFGSRSREGGRRLRATYLCPFA